MNAGVRRCREEPNLPVCRHRHVYAYFVESRLIDNIVQRAEHLRKHHVERVRAAARMQICKLHRALC